MSTNLFIGRLPYAVTSEQLEELFAKAGEVKSARVIFDKMTQRSKGFGFVEMASEAEAKKAIEMFNNAEVQGRTIVVSEALPKEERN